MGQEHSALARTDPSAEQSSSQILLKGNEELDAATSCAAQLACSLSLSPGQGKSCSQLCVQSWDMSKAFCGRYSTAELPVNQSLGGFPGLHKTLGGDYVWIICVFPNELQG